MKNDINKTLSEFTDALKGCDASVRALEKITTEKHADDLCAHYIWDNGRQSVFLCPKAEQRGTLFTNLSGALASRPDLEEKLKSFEEADAADPFAKQLLPQAKETVVLVIPKKMCQKREYLLDGILSEADKAAALKVFIVMEDDASGVVTVNLHSRGQSAANRCAVVVYCSVGKHAHLVLNEVQDLGPNTVSMLRKRTVVDESGDFHWNICELGSAEVCDSLDVCLAGQNSSAVIYGLYFPNKEQKMTMLTRQDHIVPHTYSNLLYKGALTGSSRADWEGMIYVDPAADKTDGYQKNENLLLSENARVNTKPGLEIVTDDVKCSHGTTVADIDPDQVFYLTSRGIPLQEAERLIVQGFFDTILNLVTYSPIRGKLQEKIGMKMQEN